MKRLVHVPEEISKYDYIPNFAARGLHYDIQKGLSPVPDEEVLELFGGTYHVPLQQDSGFYGKTVILQLETQESAELSYKLTEDCREQNREQQLPPVQEAIGMVHLKGYMYKWVMQDLDKFILRGEETDAVLHRWSIRERNSFSSLTVPSASDKGMIHMVGKNWRDFFDVVIVQADKPHFFTDCIKPFRLLDGNGDLRWEKIKRKPVRLLRLTGWRGSKVLYFGDHLYSDLADLMLRHGWRTAAIVPELEQETKVVSTGDTSRLDSKQVFQEWQKEREELRVMTKNLFNPQFGSIFRTCHNPTYFSRRLCRFSDTTWPP
ncbi:hypothetical protein INR49_017334 [Caranx melampygus]|nr:hypothetical protein INR49_017334 [Caranx melampygus]